MTPAIGAATAISIFIASSTISLLPASTRWPGSTATFHTLAVMGDRTARQPSGMRRSLVRRRLDRPPATRTDPPRPSAQRSRSAQKASCCRRLNAAALPLIDPRNSRYSRRPELLRLRCAVDTSPCGKASRISQQLLRAHRIEANLIEEAQQPRRARLKLRRRVERVPHLQRAPDELIPARALPCRRRTDTRRRCRPRSPASRCAPDCTSSSPADAADRSAWPPARPDKHRPGPAPDSSRRRRCDEHRRSNRAR